MVSKDLVRQIEEKLYNDRHVTFDGLKESFSCISRSFFGDTLTERLDYKKLCASWVPTILTPEYRKNRVLAAREFLERYKREGKTLTQL